MTFADPVWLAIGLAAQLAFSARFLAQWFMSERARRSLLPTHFWFFSSIGAVLLLAYAAHQRDAVIACGQLVGLAIYLRNIEWVERHARGHAKSFVWRWLALSALALAAGLLSHAAPLTAGAERTTPLWLIVGFVGQALFTGRFVVQLVVSERAQRSENPVQFWYLSLAGSLLLLAYALSVGDAVIILGQSFGFIVYVRNLMLIHRHRRADAHGEDLQADVEELASSDREHAGEQTR